MLLTQRINLARLGQHSHFAWSNIQLPCAVRAVANGARSRLSTGATAPCSTQKKSSQNLKRHRFWHFDFWTGFDTPKQPFSAVSRHFLIRIKNARFWDCQTKANHSTRTRTECERNGFRFFRYHLFHAHTDGMFFKIP